MMMINMKVKMLLINDYNAVFLDDDGDDNDE